MGLVRRNDTLTHWGIPGMKWGFSDGVRNGNRIAEWGLLGKKKIGRTPIDR